MKKLIMKVVCIIIMCVTIVSIYIYTRYQNTSSERPLDEYEGQIDAIYSSSDMDKDGIDDQTDILEGALSYVNTKPKYASKYYDTGYPDDDYGVCTDVVAFALMNAGYDLQAEVNTDILDNPKEYGIEKADENIDFRRVKNLKIYFSNKEITLTKDIYDIDEWHGGDIVVFEKHIGIVSDRRNRDGVTYVIHHSNPYQKYYEEDILEKRDDIVGHYRIM